MKSLLLTCQVMSFPNGEQQQRSKYKLGHLKEEICTQKWSQKEAGAT